MKKTLAVIIGLVSFFLTALSISEAVKLKDEMNKEKKSEV